MCVNCPLDQCQGRFQVRRYQLTESGALAYRPFPNVSLHPQKHSVPTSVYNRHANEADDRSGSLPRNHGDLAIRYKRETTCSISSRVVVRPRLKRMAPIPISGGTFIAFNTGESSTDPEWQAEPVEAATPSTPPRIVEPIFPTKLTFSVLGSLSVGWPFRTTCLPNRVCSNSQKRSRSWRIDSIPARTAPLHRPRPERHRAGCFRSQRDGLIRDPLRESAAPGKRLCEHKERQYPSVHTSYGQQATADPRQAHRRA